MKKMKKHIRTIVSLTLAFILTFSIFPSINADASISRDETTGEILLLTQDKKASSGTRYKTLGFEIYRCASGSRTDYEPREKIVINLQNNGGCITPLDIDTEVNGKLFNVYQFNRADILKAVKSLGHTSWYNDLMSETNVQYLNFNSIMCVVKGNMRSGYLSGSAGYQNSLTYNYYNNYPGINTGKIFGVYDLEGGDFFNKTRTGWVFNNQSSLQSAYAWASSGALANNGDHFNQKVYFSPLVKEVEQMQLPVGKTLIQSMSDFHNTPEYYTGNEPENPDFNWYEGYIPVLEKIKNRVQADAWYGSVYYQQYGERKDFTLNFDIAYPVKKYRTVHSTSYKNGVKHSSSHQESYTVTEHKKYTTKVPRITYYWTINNYYVYGLNSMSVENNAYPSSLSYGGAPGVSAQHIVTPEHVDWTQCYHNDTINIDASDYASGCRKAENTKEDYVKYPIIWNDLLTVNNNQRAIAYSKNAKLQTTEELYKTEQPTLMVMGDQVIIEDTQTVKIPYYVKNGYYGTKVGANYTLRNSYNSTMSASKAYSSRISTAYTMDKSASEASKNITHIIQ